MRDLDSRLHVLLVGNYEPDEQQSMQRFAQLLLEQLPVSGISASLIRPEPWFARVRPTASGIGKWLGYADKFLRFPRILKSTIAACQREGKAVVVHICDHSNAPYTRHLEAVPHLVTCHDLLAIRSARGEIPQHSTRWSGRQLQRMISRGLRCARAITCVSETTRRDLLRVSGVDSRLVSVTHNGLNFPYAPLPAGEAWQMLAPKLPAQWEQPFRFIFHVGGNQWYKNRPGVLRAYAEWCRGSRENVRLVMAGPPLDAACAAVLDAQKLGAHVAAVENCSSEQLQALYSLADALFFPSLAEGFGWPVIEAQACGCPVVTTDVPPLNEIAGAGAVFIAAMPAESDETLVPAWPRIAADALESVLTEIPEVRAVRVEQGLANARRFSTARMIREYVALYRQLALGA